MFETVEISEHTVGIAIDEENHLWVTDYHGSYDGFGGSLKRISPSGVIVGDYDMDFPFTRIDGDATGYLVQMNE